MAPGALVLQLGSCFLTLYLRSFACGRPITFAGMFKYRLRQLVGVTVFTYLTTGARFLKN
jgi:hypothetical protein